MVGWCYVLWLSRRKAPPDTEGIEISTSICWTWTNGQVAKSRRTSRAIYCK